MYRIDRAREMCAQIGLGDAIMMYKDSQTGLSWMFGLWAGVGPRFGGVVTACGPL